MEKTVIIGKCAGIGRTTIAKIMAEENVDIVTKKPMEEKTYKITAAPSFLGPESEIPKTRKERRAKKRKNEKRKR